LQRAFPLDILMVYSLKLSFIDNSSNPTGIGLTLGETICFSSLEFTADCFGRLSLSPEEGDSDALCVGMVHSGSPSLHPPSRIPPMKAVLPRAKGEALDSPAPEGATW
jgi:hypothetical protein